jgi:hypothetical protein
MKTVAEIKETIEETRAHVRHLRSIKWTHDYDADPPGLEEGEGWINALEWVLDGDGFDFPLTYPIDIEEDNYAPEETFQEDLPSSEGGTSEESPVQRYLRLCS